VVSHDRYFLDRICDQIISFEEGEVVVQTGNYSYYLEKKLQRDTHYRRLEQSYRKATAASETRVRSDRTRKLTFNETRELEGIEETILAAEEKASHIERKLNDPDFFVEHYEEATRLSDELEPAKTEVARLYDRWQELEAIRAAAEAQGAQGQGR
jgi:ATP-binding cassette subfamily F protein uup